MSPYWISDRGTLWTNLWVMQRRLPWALIAAWLAVGVTGRFAIAASVTGRATPTMIVIGVEAGVVWGLAWVAALVPRTVTLTALRVVVPAAVVAAGVTFAAGDSIAWSVAFTVTSLIALAALAHPVTIDAFVDGSAYGPERRFALRTPPLLALAAVPPVWAVVAMVGLVAPLAVTGSWIPALVIAVVWALALPRTLGSLHLPARRWVVFVPAGMVLSDPLTLADRVLFPRRDIRALGPAFAQTDAVDLTRGTFGLALQLDLGDPFELPFLADGDDGEELVTTDRIVFAVLRPGALLATAAERRVNVGETVATPPPDRPRPGESQTAVPLPRTRSSR